MSDWSYAFSAASEVVVRQRRGREHSKLTAEPLVIEDTLRVFLLKNSYWLQWIPLTVQVALLTFDLFICFKNLSYN